MKRYSIDFAFDDEAGTYTCFAKNLGQAIEKFSLMVEQMATSIDIIRAYEVEHGKPQDKPERPVTNNPRELRMRDLREKKVSGEQA
jgi:hypothetical protein